MASRARKKKNNSPCSSRCGLAALQRGYRHCLHRRFCCLFLGRSGLYPGGRALGCGPGGTLPSGHARRYSSCHSVTSARALAIAPAHRGRRRASLSLSRFQDTSRPGTDDVTLRGWPLSQSLSSLSYFRLGRIMAPLLQDYSIFFSS